MERVTGVDASFEYGETPSWHDSRKAMRSGSPGPTCFANTPGPSPSTPP